MACPNVDNRLSKQAHRSGSATSVEARADPRESAFLVFHEANPSVYRELVRRARWAAARGAKRLGIRMLWEVLRWDVTFQTVRLEGEPKLNDHWPPFYARLIQAQEEDLRGLFETRGRHADAHGEEVAP